MKVLDINQTYQLIHIGKCAGKSVKKELNKLNIKYKKIHTKKPKYNSNHKYIILIRNPISRFISAFNWRYKLLCIEKNKKYDIYKRERETLKIYKTPNNLAENLYNNDGSVKLRISKTDNYIQHVYEDIHFYLWDILKYLNRNNVVSVITTENYKNDMKNRLGIGVSYFEHKNKYYNRTYLSLKGYENLKRYLYKDYICIDMLYNKKLITTKQYKLLRER